MQILSWNVNGLRALSKKGQFDWLVNTGAEIICLQETKSEKEQLLPAIVNPPGYHSYFDHSKGRKGYSGVATYSKIKPEKIVYEMGVETLDKEGRLIAVFYSDFVLLNVYFPNGGGGPERLKYKLDFYEAFLTYAELIRKQNPKLIICGDVNTAHEEIDLARPKENETRTGFLPVEREWLDEVLNHGYVDVFRYFNPGKVVYTYWDTYTFARERNVGWRIDYFFITPNLLARVKKIDILSNVYGSDHCPILLELK